MKLQQYCNSDVIVKCDETFSIKAITAKDVLISLHAEQIPASSLKVCSVCVTKYCIHWKHFIQTNDVLVCLEITVLYLQMLDMNRSVNLSLSTVDLDTDNSFTNQPKHRRFYRAISD